MVDALRIVITGNIPYEHVKIYSQFLGGPMPAPDLFEDSQLVFTCKHGKFVLPDYAIRVIQLHNRTKVRPPDTALRVKRILLSDDLNYQDCHIIKQEDYGRFGVPQIFREYEQLTFLCKDGLYITPDFQVQYIHLE